MCQWKSRWGWEVDQSGWLYSSIMPEIAVGCDVVVVESLWLTSVQNCSYNKKCFLSFCFFLSPSSYYAFPDLLCFLRTGCTMGSFLFSFTGPFNKIWLYISTIIIRFLFKISFSCVVGSFYSFSVLQFNEIPNWLCFGGMMIQIPTSYDVNVTKHIWHHRDKPWHQII